MSDDPLDQINRFVIVLVALLAIFAAGLVVLLAWGASSDAIRWIENFAGFLRDNETRETRVIISLLALVASMLLLTLVIVELTPSPTQKMRLRNMHAGDATISTKQIAERIDDEVSRVAHVARCESVVAARGKRVDVVLDLHVGAGADLARTADEACRRAHILVEEQLGIALVQRPRARLHYRELRLKDDGTPQTGWERPPDEGTDDERGHADTPEEAQA